MKRHPFVVLMAEDDRHDIVAAQRAWRKHEFANPLHIVRDGEQCLDYLLQRGEYSAPGAAPQAGILLLDVNMPRMNGLSVLKFIREHAALRLLPVVVMTTSVLEEDCIRSYDLGANAFIRKPIGFDHFSEALRTTHTFWNLTELPR